MGIQEWSDQVLVVDLADDPLLTDDLNALFDSLAARGDRHVVVDFSAVSFLNSSNLATLLKLRKYQHDRRRKLRLCALPEAVSSVFHVTGLEALFEFVPQLSTALAELQLNGGKK